MIAPENAYLFCNWLWWTPRDISAFGLALDIIGIAVLFRFQVDPNAQIRSDGASFLQLEGSGAGDGEEKQKYSKYRKLTYLGFSLLLLGFALQLVGTVCQPS